MAGSWSRRADIDEGRRDDGLTTEARADIDEGADLVSRSLL